MESPNLLDEIVELAECHHITFSSHDMVQDGKLKFMFILEDFDRNHHKEYLMNGTSHAKFESYKDGLEYAVKYAKKYLENGRKPYCGK